MFRNILRYNQKSYKLRGDLKRLHGTVYIFIYIYMNLFISIFKIRTRVLHVIFKGLLFELDRVFKYEEFVPVQGEASDWNKFRVLENPV